jgi:hypothetical protein
MREHLNSIEIGDIFLEENKIILKLDKKAIIEEFAGTPATGGSVATSTGAPIATYGAKPAKNKKIMQKNKYPSPTLQGDVSDVKLSKAR